MKLMYFHHGVNDPVSDEVTSVAYFTTTLAMLLFILM